MSCSLAAPMSARLLALALLPGVASFLPSADYQNWTAKTLGSESEWTAISNMTQIRADPAVVAVDGKVYAFCGSNNHGPTNTAEAYDPKADQWSPIASPRKERQSHAAAALDGKIYVVGGDVVLLKSSASVEVYDPVIDQWSVVASPKDYRKGLGLATLGGKLYAAGGFHDSNNPFLPSTFFKSVEAYDPHTDRWTPVASMGIDRHGLGLAALKGKLYAVGGATKNGGFLATVETYDPKTNSWTAVASMAAARVWPGVAVLNDKLYVMGGLLTYQTVEEYDPETDQWSTMPPMKIRRSGLGAAALGGRVYAVGGVRTGQFFGKSAEVFEPSRTAVV